MSPAVFHATCRLAGVVTTHARKPPQSGAGAAPPDPLDDLDTMLGSATPQRQQSAREALASGEPEGGCARRNDLASEAESQKPLLGMLLDCNALHAGQAVLHLGCVDTQLGAGALATHILTCIRWSSLMRRHLQAAEPAAGQRAGPGQRPARRRLGSPAVGARARHASLLG